MDKVKITKISISPSTVQVVKKNIKLSVTAYEGYGEYTYRVYVYRNGKLANSQQIITDRNVVSYNYTPKAAGVYSFKVIVTDEAGTKDTKSKNIVVVSKALQAVSLKANALSVKRGKVIKFTMKVSGGKVPYRYRYVVYNSAGKKVKDSKYISKGTWNWRTGKKGTYQIKVTVKDGTGKTVTKTLKKIRVK